jgi:four helix bundle protein
MRRASVSIPSNIAEGYIKSSQKDLNRFLDMSLGSCAELETQIIIAKELGYLKEIEYKNMMEKIIAEIKQITSLKNRIANS